MAPHHDTSPSPPAQPSPIERFFASFPDFQYNPTQSIAEEYQSMRRFYGWRRGDAEGARAWAGFRLALVKEFNWLFGTDEHDLLAWQNVCALVGIGESLETCEDCIRSLKNRHFNLVDLLDARRRGSGVAQVFLTLEALLEYTRRTASHFPYRHPKAGNLLKRLLRKSRGNTMGALARSTLLKAPAFPPLRTQDERARARARDNMLPATRGSKEHRTMIAEAVEVADGCLDADFELE